MTRSSAGLDDRRRRALYRAWHRGMRETDLILGSFADSEISDLDETELLEFEKILEQTDADILKWVTGEQAAPSAFDSVLFSRIKKYRPVPGS